MLTPMRRGSCEVSMPPKKLTPWEVLNIPEAKYMAMVEYAKRLRAKHPHMKDARLRRKVSEEFKIKLT